MNMLLLGGSGRVGSRIQAQLLAHNAAAASAARRHRIHTPSINELDLTTMATPARWQSWCQGIDVVIHAAGVLREQIDNSFAAHFIAARALCTTARSSGVRHLVRVSCAGADDQSAVPWFAANGAIDALFSASGVPATIVRSGALYVEGESGSARRYHPYALTLDWHRATGALPQTPIDDVVTAIVNAAVSVAPRRAAILDLAAPRMARAA